MDQKIKVAEMAKLPKLIYRVNATSIKTPPGFFTETEKLILKFMCRFKGSRTEKQKHSVTQLGTFLKRQTRTLCSSHSMFIHEFVLKGHGKTCTQIFIVALFVTAPNWK